MQNNINFFLKVLVVVVIFGMVFYFFFGKDGKVAKAQDEINMIQKSNETNRQQLQEQMEFEKGYE